MKFKKPIGKKNVELPDLRKNKMLDFTEDLGEAVSHIITQSGLQPDIIQLHNVFYRGSTKYGGDACLRAGNYVITATLENETPFFNIYDRQISTKKDKDPYNRIEGIRDIDETHFANQSIISSPFLEEVLEYASNIGFNFSNFAHVQNAGDMGAIILVNNDEILSITKPELYEARELTIKKSS